MKKKTALVTGGAGFIGSHLVDLLIEKGYKVVVIDNLSSGHKENINPKAIFCKYDISNPVVKALFAFHKPDYVFHLAANAKISECTDKPVDTFNNNVLNTLYLLQLAREFKVKGFIYSSSSSVYGEVTVQEPINESIPTRPISIYGLEKLQAEQLVSLYAPIYGVPTISLRYFNVYGTSRQKPSGAYPNVFSAFIRDNQEKGKVTIYGNGMQQRDFIHVYDVVQANLLAAKAAQKYNGSVINIGTGKPTNINTISYMFDFPVIYAPARKEDPMYSCADNRMAKKILGMNKFISLKEGIKILLASYCVHKVVGKVNYDKLCKQCKGIYVDGRID